MKCNEISRVFKKWNISAKFFGHGVVWPSLLPLLEKGQLEYCMKWAGLCRHISGTPTLQSPHLRTYDACIQGRIRANNEGGLTITVEFWEGDSVYGEPKYEDPVVILTITMPPEMELLSGMEGECQRYIRREAERLYHEEQEREAKRKAEERIQGILQEMFQ